jgi:glycosyltransferase involved in cell wall biosynthesis
VLVVDDYSTDGSYELATNFSALHNNIKLFRTDINSGPSAARNIALDVSSGDYVVFVDADDWLEPDAIGNMVYAMKNVDLVLSNHYRIHNNNRIISDILPKTMEMDIKSMAEKMLRYLYEPNKFLLYCNPWAKMFNRKLIGNLRFDKALHSFEDLDFNIQYMEKVKKSKFIENALYNHRIRGENYASTAFSVNNSIDKLFGYRVVLPKLKQFIKNRISDSKIDQIYGNGFIRLSIISLMRTCGQMTSQNKSDMFLYIKNLLTDPEMASSIKQYNRKSGESWIIPFSIRWKLPHITMFLCQLRARKRYGKLHR